VTASSCIVLRTTQVDPKPGHASRPHAPTGHAAILPTGPTVPSMPRAPAESSRRTGTYSCRSLHREAKGARLYKVANPVHCARLHPTTRRAPPAPLPLPEPSSSLRAQSSSDNTFSTSTTSSSSSSPHVLASPTDLLVGICPLVATTAGHRRASSPEPPWSPIPAEVEP
jgi:hypothetical protein